jgi:hypothetical protein
LYVAFNDNCLDMTRANPATNQREQRFGVQRPGGNPEEFGGIAKINLSTGEILRFNLQRSPGTGAALATAGDLIFHGDVNRRLRAFDAATVRREPTASRVRISSRAKAK